MSEPAKPDPEKRPTNRTPRRARARKAPAKRKPKARRDWTKPFLAALEEGETVAGACRVASIARSTAYDRRDVDEAFADRWDELEEKATDELEATAYRRALNGSDRLMEVLLRARRPAKYRERFELEHSDKKKAGEEQRVAPAAPDDRRQVLERLVEAGAIAGDNVVPIPKKERRSA